VKRFFPLFLFFFFSFALIAQEDERDRRTERSYSPDRADVILIGELSRTSQWSLKNEALSMIGQTLDRGTRDPELLGALEFLAFEGVLNKTRENGKTTNNYPDIRAKAVSYLGVYGGEDAKKILLQTIRHDPESMILTRAINALSAIGISAADESAINDMIRRFDKRRPDNLLAFAVLEAYRKYAEETDGRLNIATRQVVYSFTQGRYLKAVKDKAKEVLDLMRGRKE
jgi:hypothetical protein